MGQEYDSTKRCGAPHLKAPERDVIERLLREGTPKKEIARILRRDIRTIQREIKRGSVEQRKPNPSMNKRPETPEYLTYTAYFADAGQRVYEANHRQSGVRRKLLECSALIAFVEEKVLGPERWSPDAAIGYAQAQGLFTATISTKSFYNWIDEGLVKIRNIDLPLKVRRRAKRPRAQRKKTLGKSIDLRPAAVDERAEFGHWEGDGIVGKNHKGHLITLVERKTGFGCLFNATDRNSERIVTILDGLHEQFASDFPRIFKTITFDNGSEFSSSDDIERGGRLEAYYAHPYSAWERPINEHWNGMVRRFIPKGSSFDSLSNLDLARIAHFLNTMPRKRLGYKSPMDLWNTHLSAMMDA